MKAKADRAPTAGVPVHALLELFDAAFSAGRDWHRRVRPHQLEVGIQKFCRDRGGALSIVAINIRRNL